MSKAPSLKSVLSAYRSSHWLSQDDWNHVVAPLVAALPRRPSAGIHALLDLWADASVELHPQAKGGIAFYLAQAGYPVTAASERSKRGERELIAHNVGEPDADFDLVAKHAGRTQERITLGLIDSGIEIGHDELKAKEWTNPGHLPNGTDYKTGKAGDLHGWDFVDNDGDPSNGRDHGTYTFGAATRGGTRVLGIPLRVDSWNAPHDIPDAIDYAAEHGAKVISLSQYSVNHAANGAVWGAPDKVQQVLAAMKRHPDVLFLFAAGNSGWNDGQSGLKLGQGRLSSDNFLPANELPNLVVVAAAEDNGSPATYTNFGLPFATIAEYANIFTTSPGNHYKDLRPGGTSLATPQAANVAAKVLLLAPHLTPEQVKQLLIQTADERKEWRTLAVSGGPINSARAYRLAALSGLVHDGMSVESAAVSLKLHGAEKNRLVGLVCSDVSSSEKAAPLFCAKAA